MTAGNKGAKKDKKKKGKNEAKKLQKKQPKNQPKKKEPKDKKSQVLRAARAEYLRRQMEINRREDEMNEELEVFNLRVNQQLLGFVDVRSFFFPH